MQERTDPFQGEDVMPSRSIEDVFAEHRERLMAIPAVVGIAQGRHDNKPCIKVYVSKKDAESIQDIPQTLEGYAVVIEETGEFRALPDD